MQQRRKIPKLAHNSMLLESLSISDVGLHFLSSLTPVPVPHPFIPQNLGDSLGPPGQSQWPYLDNLGWIIFQIPLPSKATFHSLWGQKIRASLLCLQHFHQPHPTYLASGIL